MAELREVLEQPHPHLVQVTMIHLSSSKDLPRTCGGENSLAFSVENHAFRKGAPDPEKALLSDFRLAHQRLLEKVVEHTSKWTLNAIEENWAEYQVAARDVAHRWLEKAKRDNDLLYPLLRKHP